MMRHAGVAVTMMLVVSSCVVSACAAAEPEVLPRRTLQLVDVSGAVRQELEVEVAANDSARQTGLMHRTRLAESAGMLFVYPPVAGGHTVRMWMRNTLIPLDMIFIRGDVVAGIHATAKPHDETIITSPDGTTAVLEVNGGWAARYGVQAGWRVRVVNR